jgi:hypothetical protein
MWRKHSPYDARTEGERQRNLARLGTRWQANTTPEPGRRHQATLRARWWGGFWWGWFWGSWR